MAPIEPRYLRMDAWITPEGSGAIYRVVYPRKRYTWRERMGRKKRLAEAKRFRRFLSMRRNSEVLIDEVTDTVEGRR